MLLELSKKNESKHYNLLSLSFTQDSARLGHAHIIADIVNRQAYCYGHDEQITGIQVYQLMQDAYWQCRNTGTRHTEDTPLTIEHVFPITSRYFSNQISNYRVVYHKNPFELRLRRTVPQWLLELETEHDSELQGVA